MYFQYGKQLHPHPCQEILTSTGASAHGLAALRQLPHLWQPPQIFALHFVSNGWFIPGCSRSRERKFERSDT